MSNQTQKIVSELNIQELHNMALQYGFLILRPAWLEDKPDLQIEIPTHEQRDVIGKI